MVMSAWAKDQGLEGNDFITFLADPAAELTRSLGMVMEHPGPASVLGSPRSKRFAMYVDNAEIKIVKVSEAKDDPAGDDNPSNTLAESMITAIEQLQKEL
eukprot:TRINITY_DN1804_c0_g1_i1.p4 TRINITY_DN1804_c0_g1~~TRINITY_DN1804_c0_g1_i1.p4  ORF type:complete len:100 (-),score=35.26 TRINITY_DN1804_c0_g1_i1:374-673(-)